MKRGLVFGAALACCQAFGAGAEPLLVQSGEHENFTRLVLPMPRGNEWVVTQSDNQVVLKFDTHNEGFNTDAIFSRIPRDRIGQVQSDRNSLTLTLECDCQVATFLEQDLYVVLDVAANDVSLAGTRVNPQQEGIAPAVELAQQAQQQDPTPPPKSETAPVLPLLPESRRASTPVLNFPQPVLDRPELRDSEQRVLSDMQQRLAEQLGSAATRGVLTPTPGETPKEPSQLTSASPQAVMAPQPVETAEPTPFSNIRISSSLDRPDGPSALNQILGGGDLSCPQIGSLDVSDWGSSDPFSAQIADARQGLYSEVDRLDRSIALQLAQRYIFFGFGAEARQILQLDPALAQEQTALLVIADILDGVTPTDFTILTRRSPCDPDATLWATLAQPVPVTGAKPDTDAALRALSKLPPHLRQFIAPALSKKLLDYGDEQSAEMALRSLTRLPDPMQSGARLARAEIDLYQGKTEEGAAQLAQVAEENSEYSPTALIALIDAKIAANQPIDIDAANLVAAYAKELKDTKLGPELRRAHVLALLKSGQFDQAFVISEDLGGDDDTKAAAELRIQLIRHLTEAADDIVFLDYIFDQHDNDIAELPARDLEALAARFLATGFPARAEKTIKYLPLETLQPHQKILAAQISLALSKPQMAQANLLGVEGEEADRLRADALHMTGAHEEAHALYTQAAQPEAAAETAWLAENWQGLMAQDTPVFGATSSIAAFASDPIDRSAGMLARTASALNESAAARQTLSDLLNATEMSISETN